MKQLKRRIRLFQLLMSNKLYSRKEVLKRIRDEFYMDSFTSSYSDATLSRDLECLRDFGIMVANKNRYYEIDYSQSEHGIKLFKTLEFLNFNKLLEHKNSSNVLFDYGNRVEDNGLEKMSIILEAIKKQKELVIDYINYDGIEQKDDKFKPLFFREFDSRWYLIVENKTQRGHSLALDRMKNIKLSTKSFIPSGNITPNFYYNCIGCNTIDPIEKVRLWVDKYQMNYFNNQPFHRTQQVIEEINNGTIIEIEVHTNFELMQYLLKYGKNIYVIAPTELKERMKNEIKKMENLYH
ncbi:MAG: WYL domain-containing protein [Flavobacteriales bacterium]|jgi:predicted DNA-binding transcriptional regulator YafY|nr:WYL domain-containing protein [Flavobacteriales bacterium]